MKSFLSCLAAGTLAAGVGLSAHAENADSDGRFRIAGFDVQGNTLLPQKDVDAVLSPFLGDNRDFGDVQKALEALENVYRQRGYSVVQVLLPEQELQQGVVKLTVMQSRIGKVTVSGNRFFDEENIRRSLPTLREGETPNMPLLSANLLAANRNPAKRTNVQLKSAEADGTIDAVVTVEDQKPWRVGATIDNTGTGTTGKTHIGFSYQNANLSGRDDVMSLQYTTTAEEPSRVGVYGIGYHLPFYGRSSSLDLYASYSDVDSGTVTVGLTDLKVSGKGTTFGGRYSLMLDRSTDYESRLSFGFDYKAFRNNVLLAGLQLGNDVTVHPLNISYLGSWTPSSMAVNYFVTGVQNISGNDADFARARSGADASYNLVRYGAGFDYRLPADWVVHAGMNGQWTNDALVAGEQFGAGGAGSVRGFTEREVANDRGRVVNLELNTPDWCSGTSGIQCRGVMFYDNAYLSRVKPLAGEAASESISSAGFGVRMSASRNFSLQADYGRVIDAGGLSKRGDQRLHFLLVLSY